MAEDTSGGADAAVATQETETTEQSIQQQSETYAPEELEEIWGRAIDSRLSVALQQALTPFQRQLDQRLTRIEQLAPRLEELQPQLEKVMGSVRRVEKLNRDILTGKTLTDEQVTAIENAEVLEQRQEQDARRQREEAQRQREREESEKSRITPQQVRDYAFGSAWELSKQRTERFAKRQGYKGWADIQDTVMAIQRPAGSDERPDFGLPDWEDKAEQAILTKAAARDAEGNATVNVPSLRGGGGQSATDIVAAFGREENPIPWSPKVAAAMKELGLSV